MEQNLGIRISAADLASGPLGLIGRNFSQLRGAVSTGMPRILAGFAAMGAGLATLGAGMGTIRTALDFARFSGEFDIEMAAVRTITQASEDDFRRLSGAAVEAGLRTQFAPAEAAGGLRTLAQQGLITTDAIEGLVPVLDFAAAGGLDVAEAAEVAMGTMNAYGMTVDNMTSVTDRLMRGTQLSALSANEFITVMGRAASSGRIFGTDLDDVIIALGSMRSAGIPATVATTALGEAMRRLITDRSSLETLRRYNVEIENNEGNLRSVIDITRDFQAAISGETEARQAQLVSQTFGVRGMREFSAMAAIQARVMRDGEAVTLTGAEALAHYRRELGNAGGTTEEFRRTRLATFQGQLTLLSGTVDTFRTVFGHTFGVVFRPIALAITESINVLSNAWRSMSERTQTVIAIVTLAAAGMAVFLGGILTVAGAATVLVTILGSVLGTVAAVMAGVVVAMIPVFAIIGAWVGLLVALRQAYIDNLGGVATFVDSWVGRIRLAWQALTEIITTDSFSEGVRAQLGLAENSGIRPFVMSIRDMVRRAQEIFSGFRERFSEVWQAMAPVFAELRGAFTNLMTQVFGVGSALTGSANSIPFESYASFGAMLADTVGGALRFVVQGITAAIRIFLGLYRVIRFVWAIIEPFFNIWLAVMRPIVAALRIIYRIMSGIGNIMRWVSPATWAVEGLRALGRRGETPEATPSRDPLEELSRTRRSREQSERTEAATSRPAASDAEARRDSADVLLERLRGAEGGRRRGVERVENRVSLQLDRRELASIIQELNLDSETGSGGVVTDEFGYLQTSG